MSGRVPMSIANRVKHGRKMRGLSPYMLAKKAGVAWRTVVRIEAGNDYRMSSLKKIEDALGIVLCEHAIGK